MSASSLGVTTYLVPPLTIVMGLVFLDETPPTIAYVGGALALFGVWVARRRKASTKIDVEEPAAAPSTV
jgi:drug/metabolite transporter (DMT)-like permease